MCQKDGNRHIKTLFKKDYFIHFNTVHEAVFSNGYKTKSTNGHIINGPFNDNIDFDVIQLNHYKCKTLEEFRYIRTRQRADVSIQLTEKENVDESFNAYDINEIEELTAFNFYKNVLEESKFYNHK
jgi:hypothetical protein